jgi:uncharacterized protein YndB with AHSA1/START domain
MEQGKVAERPSLALQRRYPVAPEKVWRAWTDPQALSQWWGSGPGTVSSASLDVRVGGRYRIVFGGSDGNEHEVVGVYKEVVQNKRLVFTWSWPRTTPERESIVTIVFKAAGGGTELDFSHEQFFDETARDGHKRGWTVALDSLDRFLANS